MAVLCVGQSAPVAPDPFAHVHSFKLHWRSEFSVWLTDSYCDSVQVVSDEHTPHPLWSREYAVDRYCVPLHVFTAEQTRSTVAVGAVVWHVTPREHTAHVVHEVRRCDDESWNVPESHALHVRTSSSVSADIFSPAPQKGCATHVPSRWPSLSLYVLSGQSEHMRASVLLSALIFWPLLHKVCVLHVSNR